MAVSVEAEAQGDRRLIGRSELFACLFFSEMFLFLAFTYDWAAFLLTVFVYAIVCCPLLLSRHAHMRGFFALYGGGWVQSVWRRAALAAVLLAEFLGFCLAVVSVLCVKKYAPFHVLGAGLIMLFGFLPFLYFYGKAKSFSELKKLLFFKVSILVGVLFSMWVDLFCDIDFFSASSATCSAVGGDVCGAYVAFQYWFEKVVYSIVFLLPVPAYVAGLVAILVNMNIAAGFFIVALLLFVVEFYVFMKKIACRFQRL